MVAAQGNGISLPQPDLLRWGLGLVFVFLALGVTLWLIRRYSLRGMIGMRSPMRILATMPIGARERLLVVQVGEQQWVLGVAPGVITRIGTLEGDSKMEFTQAVTPSFQGILQTLALREHNKVTCKVEHE